MSDSVFPTIEFDYHKNGDGVACTFPMKGQEGLTKRELFAAFAMAGELASQGEGIGEYTPSETNAIALAGKCVLFADKLIEVLNDSGN